MTDTDTLAEALWLAMIEDRDPSTVTEDVAAIHPNDWRMEYRDEALRLIDALAPALTARDVVLRERAERAEGQVADAHALAERAATLKEDAERVHAFTHPSELAHRVAALTSALIDDLRAVLDPATATTHNTHIAAQALREAADDVKRVRQWGLRPDENYGPSSDAFEKWLRDRAAALDPTQEDDHA